MKLQLVEKKNPTPEVTTFIFKPEGPLTWKAGQFFRYQLEDPSPDDRGESRFFTIAAAPFEGHIQITTKFAKELGSTFKKDLQKLAVGDEIEGYGPSGSFTLNYPEEPHVFIAGGIGITPFRSMILELAHNKEPINILLLYANRDENIVFKDEFEEIQSSHPEFKVHYFIGDNKIDETVIRKLVADPEKPIYYISGPEPMVQSFEKMLAQMGVPEDHIKRDYFPGYAVI